MTNTFRARDRAVIIIINWNRKNLTDRCLHSLKESLGPSLKVLLVDNGSTDGSVEYLKNKHPDITLVESPSNLGFSKANNLALRYLKENAVASDYVIFLNNDVVVNDRSLDLTLDFLDDRQDVQAAIPTILHAENVYQTGIGGYELSIKTAFSYFFFLSILFPRRSKSLFFHQKYFSRKDLVRELDWISGVCFCLRRETADELQGFPEDFFMYAEDLAFCRKIRRRGKIVFFPGGRVFHLKEEVLNQKPSTQWLDSLFLYYRLITPSRLQNMRLFALKMIFASGFCLRILLNLPLYPARRRKIKELGLYCRHVIKTL